MADKWANSVNEISGIVNGGYNGLEERQKFYNKAYEVIKWISIN